MRPLQLWLPTLGPSLSFPEVTRDAQRAFRAWQGEPRVWFLQQLQQAGRWKEGEWWQLAIPAELLDCVDVLHIGDNGHVFGPAAEARFPNRRIDGLLDAWLNMERIGGIAYEEAPESLAWRVPRISSDGVEYVDGTVRLFPGGVAPIVEMDKEGRGRAGWPPAGQPASVSPDAESCAFYTSQTGESLRGIQMMLRWPGPLQALLPPMSGLDDLAGQAEMVQIARESASAPQVSLQRAKTSAAPYITEGWTMQECAWFWPTLVERGEQGMLFAAEGRFRLIARSLTEALQSDEWRKVMQRIIAIRRIWGAGGLFWALLLERLEADQPFQTCERCDRILEGKRRGERAKRFCSRRDDDACYRQRRAHDKRRSRAR